MASYSIGKLKGVSYLSLNNNKRLKRIYYTMCDMIKRRGLGLKFEHEYEVWSSPPDEPCCDHLIKYQVCKNDFENEGLLLHNCKPCDHAGKICDQSGDIAIGLRINGSKIECIELKLEE